MALAFALLHLDLAKRPLILLIVGLVLYFVPALLWPGLSARQLSRPATPPRWVER